MVTILFKISSWKGLKIRKNEKGRESDETEYVATSTCYSLSFPIKISDGEFAKILPLKLVRKKVQSIGR